MFDSTSVLGFVRGPVQLVGALAVLVGTAHAQSFPADNGWTALTRNGGAVLDDPSADSHTDHREIVGENTTAAYIASDNTFFYVRLRLDQTPLATTGSTVGLRSFGWGILIDTNNDLKDYEYSLILNGTGASPAITLGKNTSPTMVGDPSVQATVVKEIAAVIDTNVVVTPSAFPGVTTFNSTPDVFLSFAFPWSELNAAGLKQSDTLRIFVGTSNNGRSLTADLVAPSGVDPSTPMALEQPGVASDPVGGNVQPGDADGDGLPDSVEDKNGNGQVDPGETSAHNSDTDGDGLSDGLEDTNHNGTVDLGETDPTKADSDGDGLSDGKEDANHNGSVDSGETDPRDPDTDHGGVSDGDEVTHGTNPLDPADDHAPGDNDGDDVPDGSDNCPLVANPDQRDSDNNGVGDACEGDDGFTVEGGGGCNSSGTAGLGSLLLACAALGMVKRARARRLAR